MRRARVCRKRDRHIEVCLPGGQSKCAAKIAGILFNEVLLILNSKVKRRSAALHIMEQGYFGAANRYPSARFSA